MTGYWTTRDGQELLISEMTDDHLQNAVAWIDDRLTEMHQTLTTMYTHYKPPDDLIDRMETDITHLTDIRSEMTDELRSRHGEVEDED